MLTLPVTWERRSQVQSLNSIFLNGPEADNGTKCFQYVVAHLINPVTPYSLCSSSIMGWKYPHSSDDFQEEAFKFPEKIEGRMIKTIRIEMALVNIPGRSPCVKKPSVVRQYKNNPGRSYLYYGPFCLDRRHLPAGKTCGLYLQMAHTRKPYCKIWVCKILKKYLTHF